MQPEPPLKRRLPDLGWHRTKNRTGYATPYKCYRYSITKVKSTGVPVLMYSMTCETPSMSWSSMGGTQGLLSSLRMARELRKSREPREGGSTVSRLPCRCSSRRPASSPISYREKQRWHQGCGSAFLFLRIRIQQFFCMRIRIQEVKWMRIRIHSPVSNPWVRIPPTSVADPKYSDQGRTFYSESA